MKSMSRFAEFSDKEKQILQDALGYAGRNMGWSLEDIQRLEDLKKEVEGQ